mmetsp:Transcript_8614/g.15540  ORF Transcript_8614/g.15540 Transcript_8614/m.15540 type:complete len:233 (+) Transcript_8614:754-1452(+)
MSGLGKDGIQGRCECVDGSINISHFVQTEKSNAERLQAIRLVDSPWYSHCNLQTSLLEFVHHFRIFRFAGRIVYQYSRSLKARGGYARQTSFVERLSCLSSQFVLGCFQFGKAKLERFHGNFMKVPKSISRHGGVVTESTGCVGVHDGRPSFQTHTEGGFGGRLQFLSGPFRHHDQRRTAGSGPSFLWRRNDHVHPQIFHIRPDSATRDAIQDKDSTNVVNGFGNLSNVIVG